MFLLYVTFYRMIWYHTVVYKSIVAEIKHDISGKNVTKFCSRSKKRNYKKFFYSLGREPKSGSVGGPETKDQLRSPLWRGPVRVCLLSVCVCVCVSVCVCVWRRANKKVTLPLEIVFE